MESVQEIESILNFKQQVISNWRLAVFKIVDRAGEGAVRGLS